MVFQPRGIIPALVTPLNADETLDEGALRALVDYVITAGVHGVFVVGSTGEAYAFSHEERCRIAEVASAATAGRVPVYIGTGANTTRETVRLSRAAEAAGATAISVITPNFIRPSQAELIAHYQAVAAAVRIPVLLYNQPPRTGISLATETVRQLAAVENVVGIKDSSTSLIQAMDYISACPPDFAVLAGNDALIFATLLCGGKGAIAATGNIVPRLVVEIYDAVQAGRIDEARTLQYRLFPLRKAFELGTFPNMLKEAVNLIGLRAGPTRGPVGKMPERDLAALRSILSDLEVVK